MLRKRLIVSKVASWLGLIAACALLIGWGISAREDWMANDLMQAAENKWQHEDYLGAIHDYEQLVALYPENKVISEAHYGIGLVSFLYMDDAKAAEIAFKKVVQLESSTADPERGLEARRHLAEIYEKKLDRLTDAIVIYEGIIEVSPDHDEVLASRYKVGELYAAMGDLAQARIEWDLLVKRDPASRWAAAALYRKGGSYFGVGACKEAISVYKILYTDYASDEKSPYAKLNAADCLAMENQPKAAYALYKELETDYPNKALIARKMASLEPLTQTTN